MTDYKTARADNGSGGTVPGTPLEGPVTSTTGGSDDNWADVTGATVSIPSDFVGGLIFIDFFGTLDYVDFGDINTQIRIDIDGTPYQGPGSSNAFSLFTVGMPVSESLRKVLSSGAHTIKVQLATVASYLTVGRAKVSDGLLTVVY